MTQETPYPEMDVQEFAIRVLRDKFSPKQYIPTETPPKLRDLVTACCEGNLQLNAAESLFHSVNPESRPSFESILDYLRMMNPEQK